MTYLDILEKWAVYSEYNSEQTSFNLLSNNYVLHQVGKVIEMLLSEYDNTGMLAVIYAKTQFEKLLKKIKIPLWDVLTSPESYREEKELLALFNEPVVKDAEKEFIGRLNRIYLEITKERLIGEDDGNRKQLLESMEKVIESIDKCNVDLFMRGGKIGNVQNISTKLHIFNTLAECLLAMEKAQDGMYFCFISAGNSADCFFSFFLKSNGTLISVNDRIDEAFIGEHENSRNGRWTEGKVDDIFPYDYIFQYSQHDYKGYASKYEIDESRLDLYNLGIEVFMPIVISMLLIILKYADKEIDMPLHYLDSFLPENQLKIESSELMVLGDSSLVCGHNDIDLHFDNVKLLAGGYAEEFEWSNDRNYKETGSFTNANQMMVDLWGNGFVYDAGTIFKVNNITCLTDKESDSYIPEFIGTEKRMRLQVYQEARKQLAEYMNDQIYKAWVDYGKTDAVKAWYRASLLENKEFLYQLFINEENAVANGEISSLTGTWRRADGSINIYMMQGGFPAGHYLSENDILNCKRAEEDRYKFRCSVNGCTCNTWFVVAPNTWKDVELLTGKECPKIVKGWKEQGHRTVGNSLLNATDAVETVKTPFEYKNYFHENSKWKNAEYDFTFAFGFSKSGWNQIKKDLKGKAAQGR